jgi:hypothetical protein
MPASARSLRQSGGGEHESKTPSTNDEARGKSASIRWLVYRTRGLGAGESGAPPYTQDIVTTWRRCQWGKLGNLGKAERNRDAAWLTATHHIEKFDETTVMMLLSFQAKKEGKIKYREVYHGGHFDQQLFAVWNCVHPVQSQADCTKLVGIRERTPRPSFLVLRKLRSPVRDI